MRVHPGLPISDKLRIPTRSQSAVRLRVLRSSVVETARPPAKVPKYMLEGGRKKSVGLLRLTRMLKAEAAILEGA